MIKKYFFLLALLLLLGCIDPISSSGNDGPLSEFSTNAMVSGIAILPVAKSEESYTATITPSGGVAPYTCSLVDKNTIAGNNLNMGPDCVINGTAPFVAEDTIYPFKVKVTEANGEWTIISTTLVVEGNPLTFTLPKSLEPAPKGEFKVYDLCTPAGQNTCGAAANQLNPVGGILPYSFTTSGLPLGYFINLNGVLAGTIPELSSAKEYNITICARDAKGSQACANTILPVALEEEDYEEDENVQVDVLPQTDWRILIQGNGRYDEYSLFYGMGGDFNFNITGDQIEGSGLGNVELEHDSGGCKGNGSFEASFKVKGTFSGNQANLTLYNSQPGSYLLSYNCASLGYDVMFDAQSPYNFEEQYISITLVKGEELEKIINIPGEHARTLNWTLEVM